MKIFQLVFSIFVLLFAATAFAEPPSKTTKSVQCQNGQRPGPNGCPPQHQSCQGRCTDGTAPRPIPNNLVGACTCNPVIVEPQCKDDFDTSGSLANRTAGSPLSGPLNCIGD